MDKIGGEGLTPPKEGAMARWKRIRKWIRKRIKTLKKWRELHPIYGGWVSRHHLHEARERYYALKSIVEDNVRKLDIELPDEDEYYSTKEAFDIASKQCSEKHEDEDETLNKCICLLTCWKTLLDIKRFTSRRPGHLNNLWRAMTHIRISLMESRLLSDNPTRHLYFCKEEAYRLGVRNDPDIKEMIERLGEELVPDKPLNEQFLNTYRALLEHFNTIRTGRIHQQHINVKIYTRAFIMLIVFIAPLLMYGDIFLGDIPKGGEMGQGSILKTLLTHNSLTFVFFSGLLGGLFSVAMRERPRDRTPGEDAYQSRYIITKPFIGAAGATFLYILVIGGIFKTELIANPNALFEIGPLTFGFAFLAGFTERLVFPGFR